MLKRILNTSPPVATSGKVALRSKRLTDILNDYTWRTDPELAQLIAVPPLKTSFIRYSLAYITGSCCFSPGWCRFAIETLEGKHIGNCSYFNVDEAKGEAELSIMIGDRDYWGKGYGTDAVAALVSYVFHQTKLNRVYATPLASNIRSQKCFRKCGFVQSGYLDEGKYVLMELHRSQWQKNERKEVTCQD